MSKLVCLVSKPVCLRSSLHCCVLYMFLIALLHISLYFWKYFQIQKIFVGFYTMKWLPAGLLWDWTFFHHLHKMSLQEWQLFNQSLLIFRFLCLVAVTFSSEIHTQNTQRFGRYYLFPNLYSIKILNIKCRLDSSHIFRKKIKVLFLIKWS